MRDDFLDAGILENSYLPGSGSGICTPAFSRNVERSTTPRCGNDPAPDEVLQKDVYNDRNFRRFLRNVG